MLKKSSNRPSWQDCRNRGASKGAIIPTSYGISVNPILPMGKDYAQLITTRLCRHGFSDLPKDLLAITSVGFGAVLAFLVCILHILPIPPTPTHTHTHRPEYNTRDGTYYTMYLTVW